LFVILGLQTTQDARFYAISAKFDKPFSNEGKPLVVQFSVKHEQEMDCGGGYVKLFASDLDQKNMHGETPYHIMFGPDICGYSTKKVHVIFNYKGKNLLTKKEIRCKVSTRKFSSSSVLFMHVSVVFNKFMSNNCIHQCYNTIICKHISRLLLNVTVFSASCLYLLLLFVVT